MFSKRSNHTLWPQVVPPWIVIGAMALLLPIFAIVTLENINTQKQNSIRLLLEKGAALIRSFEAGTRTGMLGATWSTGRLQILLEETARQPDISHIVVTDRLGGVVAHNNSEFMGKRYLNPPAEVTGKVQWRILEVGEKKIFEVYRSFTPGALPLRILQEVHRELPQNHPFTRCTGISDRVIFVGLDMSTVEAARSSDSRHTLFMGAILLITGLSGIILLFVGQSYRSTRASFADFRAFSATLVSNMPIGLLALDTEGKITSANPVAQSILGFSEEEAMGEPGESLLPGELWREVERQKEGDAPVEKEIACTLSGEDTVSLELNCTRLGDREGRFIGRLLLLKDLSEVKSLKREVDRSRRLASIGLLAAGVAHEIRNPLSSIKGFATYFRERYQDVPEDLSIADIMIQETDRLNRVVGQLIEFARPVDISPKPVDVGPFMENSLALIRLQAEEKGIGVELSVAPEIHESPMDPDRISQVLLNLYLNAIDAMDEGGTLSIKILPPSEGAGIMIKVSDTGRGIDPGDLPHIFDPYFTTKSSGTGIGLAIVHNIVEAHGGNIKAAPRTAAGTCFTLYLPENIEPQNIKPGETSAP